jgi:hypothetical protein
MGTHRDRHVRRGEEWNRIAIEAIAEILHRDVAAIIIATARSAARVMLPIAERLDVE